MLIIGLVSFEPCACVQNCAHTMCGTRTAHNAWSTRSPIPSFNDKCKRLVRCLTAARRLHVSNDTAFLHPFIPVLRIRIEGRTHIISYARTREPYGLAQKTMTVISAIKIIHTHTFLQLRCGRKRDVRLILS